MGMEWIVLGAMGATAAVQASAQQKQASAAKKAEDQAAAMALKQEKETQAAANAERLQNMRKMRAEIASTRSAYAASGVRLEGSPVAVLSEQAEQMRTDIRTEYKNRMRQAAAYRGQAGLAITRGNAAKAAGRMAATGTLISGLSSIAGQGYDMYQKGWRPFGTRTGSN